MSSVSNVAWVFAFGMTLAGAGSVSAQDYPSKPVRIYCSSAGGGADFVARQISQGISGALGQPMVVVNLGNGAMAADTVFKAPPDGYSINVQGSGLWILTLLSNRAPYDV